MSNQILENVSINQIVNVAISKPNSDIACIAYDELYKEELANLLLERCITLNVLSVGNKQAIILDNLSTIIPFSLEDQDPVGFNFDIVCTYRMPLKINLGKFTSRLKIPILNKP